MGDVEPDSEARAPGRPRDDRIDGAVVQAAVLELADYGLRTFSIARVAKRAGVARATVYLRWPNRDQLILDALRQTGATLRTPVTGSLRADLQVLVHDWAMVHTDPVFMNVLLRLEADRDHFPEIAEEYVQRIALPANRTLERVFRNARNRGEIRGDANLKVAARMLVGAIWLEARFNRARISKSFQTHLVSMMEAALRAES